MHKELIKRTEALIRAKQHTMRMLQAMADRHIKKKEYKLANSALSMVDKLTKEIAEQERVLRGIK